MAEEQAEQLHTETLRFLGKELKKEGTAEKGPWKIFGLKFDVGGQFPWKCSAFDKISDKGVQVSQLIEGNFYEIWFKTHRYDTQYKKDVEGRQATLIKNSSAERATNPLKRNAPAAPVQQPAQVQTALSDDALKTFASQYDEATKDSTDVSAFHMIGAYIVNFEVESHKALIEHCKNHFKKPEPAPVPEKKPLVMA